MDSIGLQSMRRTIVNFDGDKTVEIYYLTFGKAVLAFTPQFAVCHSGWGETAAYNGLVQQLKSLNLISSEAGKEEEAQRERTGTRKVPKPGAVDPAPDLFSR